MRNLLIILSILVVYASGVSEKMVSRRLAKQIHKSCKRKSNVRLEELFRAREGFFEESQRELACYMRCILSTEKMLMSQPNVTPQSMFSIFPSELVMKIRQDDCQNIGKMSESCVSAMKVFRCLHNKYGGKFSIARGF